MLSATQKNRLMSVNTPLGTDVLLLQHLAGREGLSQLFSFELELLSEKKHDIDLSKIVGQDVTVTLQLEGGEKRYFNGVVSSFMQTAVGKVASDEVYSTYLATVVPWLWLLTRTANCRIFQDMKVPDILKKIFSEYGFGGFVEDKLTATYPVWEYCVQYRETAFNFVSRLMEQEGIYYYFTHENGKHMLVLCDSPGVHQPFPGYESIPFRPKREKAAPAGYIQEWTIGKTLQPGKFTHTDYNFKKPRTPMLEDPFAWPCSEISRQHQHAAFEVFDYPGGFVASAEGEQYAQLRMEELQAQHEIGSGRGDTRGIAPGYKFTLKNNLRSDQNRPYLVVAASYAGAVAGYATGEPGRDDEFTCSFSAIPADTPFRPPRNTPKPTIQGAQTAIVVGPAGEEIYTDEFGRVKVQFHWDREHTYGPDSSCWIRVAQTWAGKKWGALFTPRIAHEVIVEFLEGDPDQPIITGRIYNADHIPPYALPDHKTMSTMKSYSSKGGDGFNEFRFEDKKGKEQIFIHAQRNLDIRVRNNMYETNYGNREVRVGWEKDGQSGGHLNTLVRLDVNTHIKGGQYEQVEKDLNQTVEGEVVESFKKDQTTQVTGTRTLNAKEVVVETSDLISEKTAKLALEGSQEVGIKGGSVNVESSQGISLKCGGNFVTIDASGVCINGSMVKINSGGAAKPAAAAKSAQIPPIEQPVEARLADNGKTGLATGLKTPPPSPRQRAKVALAPLKAPPFKPPVFVGEGIVAREGVVDGDKATKRPESPQSVSESPCGIAELMVVDSEPDGKKRKPSSAMVLQIVTKADTVKKVEHKIGEFVKVTGQSKTVGKDEVSVEVKVVDECKAKRKQIAVTRSIIPSDWQTMASQIVAIKPPVNDDLWPSGDEPEIYYIHGRGCDETYQTIRIESFPSQQYELSIETEALSKLVEKATDTVSDFAQNLFGRLVKFKANALGGKATAEWGWQEADDWQVYFGGTVSIEWSPFVSITATITGDLLQLAGTALAIPPALTKYAPQIYVEGSIEGAIDIKGSLSKTGSDTYEGKIAPVGKIELKLEVGAKYEEFFVAVGLVGGAKSSFELAADLKWKSEGVFFEPILEWKGLTVYYKMYFAIGELEEKTNAGNGEKEKEFKNDDAIEDGHEWEICEAKIMWQPDPIELFGNSKKNGGGGAW